jgi:hypothetical protein
MRFGNDLGSGGFGSCEMPVGIVDKRTDAHGNSARFFRCTPPIEVLGVTRDSRTQHDHGFTKNELRMMDASWIVRIGKNSVFFETERSTKKLNRGRRVLVSKAGYQGVFCWHME